MSGIRELVRRAWFGLRGVDPDAVVVSFRTGDDELVRAMVEQAQQLLPGRRHYLVSIGDCAPIPGATLVVLQPQGMRRQLKRALHGVRVGMAPVLFTGDVGFAKLRGAAFRLAPRKILAYNTRLERHHLQLSCPLASLLFWRGVPLDRIWLRPGWLWPWRRDRTVRPEGVTVVDGRPLSEARSRIAVVSPYVPWPLAHGGAVRMYHLLREAAVTHDVILLAFGEHETQKELEPLKQFCWKIMIVDKPRYREPRWSTIEPPEVAEYRSPAMERALKQARQEFGARAVQVEYTQLASYHGDILVEHDITFDLYSQVLQRSRTRAAWWDWWRWHRFERAALQAFPRVVVMSPKDAELTGRKAHVIPNGVDLARFAPTPEPDGRHLLFVGSFRHFPNAMAYRFLIEQVWPRVALRLPDLRLTAVTGPEALLHWQTITGQRSIPVPERVELLEYVRDVKPRYDAANLVLVPTLVSAGTNVKVLEAMSMQRAVVSTTSGCAGIGLVHGVSVWIADGDGPFADGIVRLLQDGSLRASIAQKARRHAERYFSWHRLGALQRALWSEVLPSPVKIRKAARGDLEGIGKIQNEAPEASQWEPAGYLRYQCQVAELGGTLAGFLVWRETAPGEREILNLAVAAERRRHGIGSQLLVSALEGWTGDWYLEVRESNLPARALYERFGFQVAGRRPEYYTDSHEGGIVMRLRSC